MRADSGLKEWLEGHGISYSLRKDVLVVPGFGRFLVQDDYENAFKVAKDGAVRFDCQENASFLLADDIPYVAFPFGDRWYYVDVREDPEDQEFRVLRHIGPPPPCSRPCAYYPLGAHTGFELLNGSGLLKDWCAKAKFLGYGGLGIADRNTMAGTLNLQRCAEAAGLKFCFGYSLSVRIGAELVGAKVYSHTQEGFGNMLRIQKAVCVDNDEAREIGLIDLLNRGAGNVLVFDKWSGGWLASNRAMVPDFCKAFDGWVYFQVDTSEYSADRIDSALLQSLKSYFDAYYLGGLEYDLGLRPVLIQDAYYLDKEDWGVKAMLNKIDTGAAHEQSRSQHMKTLDELYAEFRSLFSGRYGDDVFYDMCEATADIMENAAARYDLESNFAPRYDMTEAEKARYGTPRAMLRQLAEEGFRRLVPDGEEEAYRERLEREIYVIESTDNVDYILIQRDELNWAQENGVLPGVGRGSAGGSLLLYLMGITFIDPIRYDLIFERFLMPERAGLAESAVTLVDGPFDSAERIEALFEGGGSVALDIDAELLVERGGSEAAVYADQLEPGDRVVFDNRDLLFSLPAIGSCVVASASPLGPGRSVDCHSGRGYVKKGHGSMPDIDSDFDAERRGEVKAYLERRYNRGGAQRVFSAGVFTTERIRSAVKDVARVHRVPPSSVNYFTAMLDDGLTWTGVMRLAAADKRVREFVQRHWRVFEDVLPIMWQPRAAGIHASAVVIAPEVVKGRKVECFDLLPIRKMNGLLISEVSGADIDALGFLKNDVLGVKELTRLSDVLSLVERQCGSRYTILEIATRYLDDPEVFKTVSGGNTQGLFQISGDGITKFIRRMAPDRIDDLIAAVALFRPGPLDSGAAENYVLAKKGRRDPTYLWGTYEILKNTYGELIYQEDVSKVAQRVGGLSLSDGVDLVKALSKKKLAAVRKFHEKFFAGAKANGCPLDAAEKIWACVEDAAKYSFNKSHATTYGLTAYIGAWLKVHYPTAFYTVALRDQEEERLPVLLSEIASCTGTRLEQPDINVSGADLVPDFAADAIYWSLSRIRNLGPKAVERIVEERSLNGEFDGLEDFARRIFRSRFKSFSDEGDPEARERCPVTARSVKSLVLAGAFDRVEGLSSVCERWGLLERAAALLGFAAPESEAPQELRDKPYYWRGLQARISGLGFVDYREAAANAGLPPSAAKLPFLDFREMSGLFYPHKKGLACAMVASVAEKSFKDSKTGETRKFGKIELQQNSETALLTVWDSWQELRSSLFGAEGRIVVVVAAVKWSDYDEKNVLQIGKCSYFKLL